MNRTFKLGIIGIISLIILSGAWFYINQYSQRSKATSTGIDAVIALPLSQTFTGGDTKTMKVTIQAPAGQTTNRISGFDVTLSGTGNAQIKDVGDPSTSLIGPTPAAAVVYTRVRKDANPDGSWRVAYVVQQPFGQLPYAIDLPIQVQGVSAGTGSISVQSSAVTQLVGNIGVHLYTLSVTTPTPTPTTTPPVATLTPTRTPTPTKVFLPDFTVSGAIVVSPNPQYVNQSVNIRFTIINQGNVSSPMTYMYTNQADGRSTIGVGNTCNGSTVLDPGGTCVSSYNFTFPSVGIRTLSIGLDSSNLVVESNEMNNQFTASVNIVAPGTTLTPTPTVTPSRTPTPTATLTPYPCTDSDMDAAHPDGNNPYVKGTVNGLAGNDVPTTDTDACRTPNFYGDGFDYVVEWFCWYNPTAQKYYRINTNTKCEFGCNNGACLMSIPTPTRTPTPTTAVLKPDFAISSKMAIPFSQSVNQPVNIRFTIVNQGQVSAPMTYMYVEQAGGFSTLGSGNTCTASTVLSPGGYCVSSYNFTFSTPGRKTLVIKIDVDNLVSESNESNNQGFMDVDIISPIITDTPTPTITPTTAPNCLCQTSENSCSLDCAFPTPGLDNTYVSPFKCAPSIISNPTDALKKEWCRRTSRASGDADGVDGVTLVDYDYYRRIATLDKGIIPATVNSDFNGDGEVGTLDAEIISKVLGL